MSEGMVPVIAVLSVLMFIAFWIGLTSFIAMMAGWYRLMHRFPDQKEDALLKLTWQSGLMGPGVRYNNALRFSACDHGLRLGLPKLFGLFTRDVYVPWTDVKVRSYRRYFTDLVELSFGDPEVGRLVIRPATAERLRAAVPNRWPVPSAEKNSSSR